MVDKVGHILAVVDAIRPDSAPSVFAKPVTELAADDADHLAHFIGRDGFLALNVGAGVAERPSLIVAGR